MHITSSPDSFWSSSDLSLDSPIHSLIFPSLLLSMDKYY